jgi:hypothetical protein
LYGFAERGAVGAFEGPSPRGDQKMKFLCAKAAMAAVAAKAGGQEK